jgi:hypothetical protein
VADAAAEIERLRGELEGTRESVREWRHTADEAAKQHVGLAAAARSAFAEVERLRGLLARLEWSGRDGLWPCCPACNGHQRDGHVGIGPDRTPCWLAAELRDLQ